MDWFKGREVWFVTKHKKDAAFKSLFESELGLKVVRYDEIDTDRFGTFSGEVKRRKDMLKTCRLKIEAARKESGRDLFMASEGSFGPDPIIGVLNTDLELVMLKDYKNDFEIVVSGKTYDTNMAKRTFEKWSEVTGFLEKGGFPENGVILKKGTKVYKDFENLSEVRDVFDTLVKRGFRKKVTVETDMRANRNVKRMNFLKDMAEKCVKVYCLDCPECNCPGFQITDMRTGKRCSQCHTPTSTAEYFVYSCGVCGFEKKEKNLEGGEFVDPGKCGVCNP